MAKKLYSKEMIEDYELMRLTNPYYDLIQKNIALAAVNHSNKSKIKILDLGCGSGLTSQELIKENENVEIIAIDTDARMTEMAKERLHNKKQIKFESIEGLEFLKKAENASFDAVVSGLVLHNFTKEVRNLYLREIYRVLKKSGLFVNGDKYASDDEQEHKKDLKFQLACFNNFKKLSLKEEWAKHYLGDMKEDRIMRLSYSLKELKRIGFKNPKQIFRRHMFAVVVADK